MTNRILRHGDGPLCDQAVGVRRHTCTAKVILETAGRQTHENEESGQILSGQFFDDI